MKTALKRLMQSLRMKLWKPKEGKRLAQSHKIVTLLAQALFTKTIVGENTRALLSSDGKHATECCGPVRDFEEGRNEVEEGTVGAVSCTATHSLTHTHPRSLWFQFQPSMLSGEAALGFWLQPSCLTASSLLSLPEPNCCHFVPCQGGGNSSDSRRGMTELWGTERYGEGDSETR